MADRNQMNINLSFTADTTQAERKLEELKYSLLNAVQSASKSSSLGITDEISGAITQANKLQVALSNATMHTGKLDLTKFKQELKSAGLDAQNIRESLFALGPAGETAFSQLTRAITTAEIPLKRTSTLLKKFADTLANTAKWQVASTAIHKFSGSIRSAVNYMKDLNESLNKIRIVTGQSTEQMAKFAKEANAAAKALSVSTTAYTDASLIFYQQGLTGDAVKERTEAVVKMSNVTGDSVQDVASYMTAIWNNFDDGSKSLEHYADVITALGATTASSSAEIAAGLEKFAAIGETVGLSYDYATSALAAVVANTRQSAEIVGNAFKTIFARMESLKLGETLEDGVDFTKYTQAIESVGVQVLNTNGELRDLDNILEDLAEKWQVMNSAQKSALAQTVAGTRQYNQFVALLENWDDVQTNLITAKNSEGSLQKQADIYAEGWEGASKRVRASLQTIYQTLLDDNGFVSIINGFNDFLGIVKNVIDALGGMRGLLSGLGVLVFKLFGDNIAKSLDNFVTNMRIASGAEREDSLKLRQQFSEQLKAGFGDTGESTERQQIVDSYRKQSEIQDAIIAKTRELNAQGKSLTENEQKRLNLALDLQESLSAQAQASAKQQDTAERSAAGSAFNANTLIESTFSIANVPVQVSQLDQEITVSTELLESYKNAQQETANALLELQSNLEATSEAYDNANIKNEEAKQAVENQQQAIQSLIETQNQLNQTVEQNQNLRQQVTEIQALAEVLGMTEELFVTFQNSTEEAGIKLAQINLQDVIQAFKDLGISVSGPVIDDVQQLQNALSELAQDSTKTTEVEQALASAMDTLQSKIRNVNTAFKGTANEKAMNQNLEALVRNSQNAGKAHVQHGQNVKNLDKNFKEVNKTISQSSGEIMSFSQKVVAVGGAMASLGMMMNTLRGSIEKLFDPETSAIDKIIPLLTSVGMTIGMVVSATDKLNKVRLSHTAAIAGETTALQLQNEVQEIACANALTQTTLTQEEAAAKLNEALASEAVVAATTEEEAITAIKNVTDAAGLALTEEQIASLATLVVAKKADIVTTTAEAGAHGILATAASAAAIAVKKLATALFTSPIGIIVGIAAAAAAVAGAISSWSKNNKALIESNNQVIEQEKKTQEQINSNLELVDSYEKLYQKYQDNILSQEDLADSAEKLVEKLKEEGVIVNLLQEGYDGLAKAAKEYKKQELGKALSSAESQKGAAADNILRTAREGNGGMSGNDYHVNFTEGGYEDDEDKAVEKILQMIPGMSKYHMSGDSDYNDFIIQGANIEDLVDFYHKAAEARDIARKQLSATERQDSEVYGELDEWVNKMETVIQEYEEALELVSKYQSQLATVDIKFENLDENKSFSDNYNKYIQARDKFIKAIQEATGASDEEARKMAEQEIKDQSDYLADMVSYVNEIENLVENQFANVTADEVNKWYGRLTADQKAIIMQYGLETVRTFDEADAYIQAKLEEQLGAIASRAYETASSIVEKIQSGSITSGNAIDLIQEPGEDADKKTKEAYYAYQELLGAARGLLSVYPELTTEVEILNKTWLVGTQEYFEALEKIQNKLHLLDVKEQIKQAQEAAKGLSVHLDTEDFTAQMEDLMNREYNIDIAVHSEAEQEFDRIGQSLSDLEKKANMINEDYIVAADSLRDLNNTFPGIVENLQIVGDGTVKLNKEIADSAIAAAKSEAAADAEKTVANIQNAATTLRVKQKIYESMAEDAAQLAQMEVTTDNKATALKEDIIKKYNEAVQADNQYTTNYELDNDQKIAQSSYENGKVVLENWKTAYDGSLKANYEYAKKAIENFQAIAEKDLGKLSNGLGNINYNGSTGVSITAEVPDELQKVLSGEDVTSSEYAKLTEIFTEMAVKAGAQANDLEGMIPAITAKLYKTFDKSSSSKSKKDKQDLKDFADEFDRFYPFVKVIEDLADAMSDLAKEQEHLSGMELVVSLKKQNDMLVQQKKNYEALLKEKKKYQAELQGGYTDDYGKHQYGLEDYGMQFDSETGNITNWAEITSAQNKKMNDAIIAYNSSSQDDAAKATLKAAEKNYEHFKDLISKYQTVLKDIEEEENELDDILYEQISNNLQQFEIEVKLDLDIESAKRKVQDFLKTIRTNFRQVYKESQDWANIFDVAEANALSYSQTLRTDLDALQKVKDIIDDENYNYKSSDSMFADRTEALEKYHELEDQLMSDSEAFYNLAEDTWDSYLDAIDEVLNQWDDTLKGFDRVNSQLDHSRKMLELLYDGDKSQEGRDILDSYYEQKLQTSLGIQRTLTAEINALQQNLENAKADSNEEDIKKYTDAINQATQDLNKEMEDYLELAQNRFLNALKSIMATADKALTGSTGVGIEKLSERWNDAQTAAEGYYDDVERIYQLDSLQNKWENLINSSKTLKNQQYLTSLMDAQLKRLKDKTELTEYDIGLAEKELAVLQAQMALEDARENKNSMKLVRNEQGNWTYQYVADPAEEEKKQQEMIDALYDRYEYVKKANREATEDLLELQRTAQERISAIAEEMALADGERRKELEEELNYLYDYYYGENGLIVKRSRQASNIQTDLNKVGMETLWGLYTTDQENYKNMTDNEKKLIDDLNSYGLNSFRDFVNEVSLGDGSLYKQMYEQCHKVILDTQSDWETAAHKVVNNWGTNPDSVKNTMLNALTEINNAVNEFVNAVSEGEKATGTSWTNIKEQIEAVTGSVTELNGTIDDLTSKTEALDKYRERVNLVQNAWDTVKTATMEAAKTLSEYIEKLKELRDKTITVTTKYETIGDGKDKTKVTPDSTGNTGTIPGNGNDNNDGDGNLGNGTKDTTKQRYHIISYHGVPLYYFTTANAAEEKMQFLKEKLSMKLADFNESDITHKETKLASPPTVTDPTIYQKNVGGTPGGSTAASEYYWDQNKAGQSSSPIQFKAWLASFASGGYTGEWGSTGKFAVLHEKELVLNKEDTSNLLSAVNAVREITSLGDSIMTAVASGLSGMLSRMLGIKPDISGGEQGIGTQLGNTFNITAEFPNANNVAEIEQAILNLPNLANQYLSNSSI